LGILLAQKNVRLYGVGRKAKRVWHINVKGKARHFSLRRQQLIDANWRRQTASGILPLSPFDAAHCSRRAPWNQSCIRSATRASCMTTGHRSPRKRTKEDSWDAKVFFRLNCQAGYSWFQPTWSIRTMRIWLRGIAFVFDLPCWEHGVFRSWFEEATDESRDHNPFERYVDVRFTGYEAADWDWED